MPLLKRLTTLDILRGFFLFVIIVDHVELYPSGFDFLSGRGRMWVSAAEGFFFISGLLLSYIYRARLQRGWRFVTTKILRRAGMLYVWAVALTLLFTFWAVASNHGGIKYGLPATIHWPDIVWQTLILQYSFGWADFLPRYAAFMLLAPLVLYLLATKKWWLVVLASAGVWLWRGENFTLAWQTVFYGGMVVGFYWDSLRERLARLADKPALLLRRSVIALASLTAALSYTGVFVLSTLNDFRSTLPTALQGLVQTWHTTYDAIWPFFEKWTMEPGRMLLFALWFAALYMVIDRYAGRLPGFVRGYLSLLGERSLTVYIVHAFVIFILHLAVPRTTNLIFNFLITAAVLAMIGGITYAAKVFAVRYKQNFSSRSGRARPKKLVTQNES